MIAAIFISLFDPSPVINDASISDVANLPKATKKVRVAWAALVIVMVVLYLVFNGH